MACSATNGGPDSPTARLCGAWKRIGRCVGDGGVDEPAEVWWLQATRAFADLRQPLEGAAPAPGGIDGPRAFSGDLTASGDRVTWHHDLDTGPSPGRMDTALVRVEGDLLVEAGDGYEEHWRRMSEPAEVALSAERHEDGACTARVVAVGDRAVGLWGRPVPGGGRFERREGRWRVAHQLGDIGGLEEALAALAGLTGGAPLPAGWRHP